VNTDECPECTSPFSGTESLANIVILRKDGSENELQKIVEHSGLPTQIQPPKKASIYSKVAQVPLQIAFQVVGDITGSFEDS